jgi:hypothetical protein
LLVKTKIRLQPFVLYVRKNKRKKNDFLLNANTKYRTREKRKE